MKWLALLACLILTTSAAARLNTPNDESDPDLVNLYLAFPCEALDLSYQFQIQEMIYITNRIQACHEASELNPDFEYGLLMCMYIQIQGNVMNTHSKSVDKVWHMMCDEEGQRKNPEYRI